MSTSPRNDGVRSLKAITVNTIEEVKDLIGSTLGPTEWIELKQATVNAFADVTRDRQWIHVDPVRASDGPFGSTVGHGLLTLSLGPGFTDDLLRFTGFTHVLNYGYDRVRFPAPVPIASRLRMELEVLSVTCVGGGAQLAVRQTFERDAGQKPVCVADALLRLII